MQDQVEEIKQKTDIVTIIGEHIDLKKAGRNFKAKCPFHGEKTPSFMVSPELQIYKCFGCQISGDSYTFLQEYEGMDFPEALKFLADRAGVKLKQVSTRTRGEKEKLYEINLLTTKFYEYILHKHSKGKVALNYLLKNRGLTLKTVKMFKLGFSPNNSKILTNFLVGKKKIDQKDLLKAGLTYRGRSGLVDRFAGRVIFPLFDHRGNNVGFAGRLLPSDKRDFAKYINTPETVVYQKGNNLYGLNLTRSNIKKKNAAIVVEGELDLISSWQAGIKTCVAMKGTSLTEDQVRLLSRFTKKIVLALDSDFAGNEAARRGITIAQNTGLEVRVSLMGKYKDPDEAARKNPEEYKKILKNSKDVWEFIIDFVISKYDLKGGIGKSKISRELTPVISSIEDKIVQAHYIKYLAEKLDVPVESVSQEVISKIKVEEKKVESADSVEKKDKTRKEMLEERLLSIFVNSNSKKRDRYEEYLKLITTPLSKKIVSEYKKFTKKRKKFNLSIFSSSLPEELKEGFAFLAIEEDEVDIDSREKELEQVIIELKKLNLKEKRSKLLEKIKKMEKSGKKEKTSSLSGEFDKLGRELSVLE